MATGLACLQSWFVPCRSNVWWVFKWSVTTFLHVQTYLKGKWGKNNNWHTWSQCQNNFQVWSEGMATLQSDKNFTASAFLQCGFFWCAATQILSNQKLNYIYKLLVIYCGYQVVDRRLHLYLYFLCPGSPMLYFIPLYVCIVHFLLVLCDVKRPVSLTAFLGICMQQCAIACVCLCAGGLTTDNLSLVYTLFVTLWVL